MPRYRAIQNTYLGNRYIRAGDTFTTGRAIGDSPGVLEEIDAQGNALKPTPPKAVAPEVKVSDFDAAPETNLPPPPHIADLEKDPLFGL